MALATAAGVEGVPGIRCATMCTCARPTERAMHWSSVVLMHLDAGASRISSLRSGWRRRYSDEIDERA